MYCRFEENLKNTAHVLFIDIQAYQFHNFILPPHVKANGQTLFQISQLDYLACFYTSVRCRFGARCGISWTWLAVTEISRAPFLTSCFNWKCISIQNQPSASNANYVFIKSFNATVRYDQSRLHSNCLKNVRRTVATVSSWDLIGKFGPRSPPGV